MGEVWTWDYFLVPQNRPVPDGTGFGVFSPIHLGVLVLLAVAIFQLVSGYSRSDADRRRRIRLVVGWATFLLEAVRQAAYLLRGGYSWDILPLHSCAIATFAVFIDALRSNRWSRELLYAMGGWGALMALVFPDWASRPILNAYTWQSFAVHACILAYLLMLLVSGEFIPDWRNLWRVLVVLAVVVPASLLANHYLGTNFWFLNTGAPGSPLEPIQQVAGVFYIPVLIVMLGCLWGLLYLPWRSVSARRRRTEAR